MTTIRVKHAKVSGKAASADTSKVDGPAWDNSHSGDIAEIKSDLGLVAVATSGSATDLTTGTLDAARLPAHSGDASSSAGSAVLTLATVNSNVGAFTSANITVNAKGLVTAAASGSGGGSVLLGTGNFGSGIDGAVNFDGSSAVSGFTRSGSTYTATRPDYAFTTATFSGGVVVDMSQGGTVASGELFAHKIVLPASGVVTIRLNGNPATTSTGGAALGTGHTGAVSGAGAGSNQNAGTNATAHSGNWPTRFQAGKGGHGGASATNAGSTTDIGATNILADAVGCPIKWQQLVLGRLGLNNNGIISGGGGGGSGGGTTGVAAGGAGGGGAGVLIVGFRELDTSAGSGTLVIETTGGAASNGAGGNAGGGSGGGGGYTLTGFGGSTQPAAVTVTAAGGAAGTPAGTGTAGGAGNAGQALFLKLGPS